MDPFNYVVNVNAVAPNSGITKMSDVLNVVVNVLIGSGFAISIITMGYAMFQYAMSRGEPKEIATAYNTALWGFIAAVVSLVATALRVVGIKLFGVTNPDISGSTNVVPGF